MDMGQSQLTVTLQEVQVHKKFIIKLKLKKPTTGYFPLTGSSGGVKTKQKQTTSMHCFVCICISPYPH